MDKSQKMGVWFFGIQVALALVLFYASRRAKAAAAIAVPVETSDSPDFYAPWNYPSAGIYPEAAGFQSIINVNVDNPLAGGLAYQYMPIFGLVGFNYGG